MTKIKPVFIHSDNSETDTSAFNFDLYANTFAELISYKKNITPFNIGIFTSEESGKTILMKSIYKKLNHNNKNADAIYRRCRTIWLPAWKFIDNEDIYNSLVGEIFTAMSDDNFFNTCNKEIELLIKKFAISQIVQEMTNLLKGVEISEFMSRLQIKYKLASSVSFQDFFNNLLQSYILWLTNFYSSESDFNSKSVIVIFIDGLDQIPKGISQNILGTIKYKLSLKGFIFIISASYINLRNSISENYGEYADNFLDKFFQLTFNLPESKTDEIESLIISGLKGIHTDINYDVTSYLKYILPAMHNSIRQAKKFINNLNLLYTICNRSGTEIDFKDIIKCCLLDLLCPQLFYTNNYSSFFNVIMMIINEKGVDRDNWNISHDILKGVPLQFRDIIQKKEIVDIVLNLNSTSLDIDALITRKRISENRNSQNLIENHDRIPECDDMIHVPAGFFIYGEDKYEIEIMNPFLIDIYPVTNSQFDKFIQDGGYSKDQFWTEQGRLWKEANSIHSPLFWSNPDLKKSDCPVVGVSFYEAEAYAKWAGKRLPKEIEWERAARGTDSREFPWGNKFSIDMCNTSESGIRSTTDVTAYPSGRSPVGCFDMAGNVWEWIDSWYDDSKEMRVIRGGAWSYDNMNCRCSFRGFNLPSLADQSTGFRCIKDE
ncbi:MAG: SUMF1/EgtB/PvdO family nonheme iron enzyme [Spirochaetota bacterium]|nr:SUMF1/EgtB/PvdO family nonheme iron enzyme [Spirochaetota bacterium]